MIRKIKNITLIVLIIMVVSLIIFFRKVLLKNNDVNKNANKISKIEEKLTDEQIEKYNSFNDKFYGEGAIIRLVEKNSDWSDIPLTKHFREKYNEKDGILGNIQFDKVEYCPYEEGTYPFTRTSYFVITQGKKKTAYIYSEDTIHIDDETFYYFDDITLSEPIVFVDENGNELDTRLRCTEENWQTILSNFVSQEIETQHTIAVTGSFSELYPDFQDVFLKKVPSQKDFTSVIYSIETQEKSDYSKLTATYRCFEIKNTKNMRLYKVHFILDDKQYIDDVDIEILE